MFAAAQAQDGGDDLGLLGDRERGTVEGGVGPGAPPGGRRSATQAARPGAAVRAAATGPSTQPAASARASGAIGWYFAARHPSSMAALVQAGELEVGPPLVAGLVGGHLGQADRRGDQRRTLVAAPGPRGSAPNGVSRAARPKKPAAPKVS